MKKRLSLICCLLLFSVSALATTNNDRQQLFSFAEKLYLEADYYRAIGEYKRWRFLFPQDKRAPYVSWKIGMSYLNGKKYNAAEKYFKIACSQRKKINDGEKFCFSLATLAWKNGNKEDALALYQRFINDFPHSKYLGKAAYRIAWVFLDSYAFAEAAEQFNKLERTKRNRELAAESWALAKLPKIEPWRYALSSALLPGSGQLALGHYNEALSAVLVVGLSAFASYKLFDEGDHGFAAALSLIGGSFYLGNIFSAANLASKGKKRRVEKKLNKLRDNYLSKPIDL